MFFDNLLGLVTTLFRKSLKNIKKFAFFLFFKISLVLLLENLSLKKRDYMYGCCVLDIF
jgi:hypothetical protein